MCIRDSVITERLDVELSELSREVGRRQPAAAAARSTALESITAENHGVTPDVLGRAEVGGRGRPLSSSRGEVARGNKCERYHDPCESSALHHCFSY